MSIAEQVARWAREERYAIAAAQPDVTDEQARAVADCEEAARVDRALGLEPTCTCGSGHRWGAP